MFGSTYFENPLTYRDATQINEAMGRVYLHMGLAVLTSMVVSMLVASSPALLAFFFTGAMKWVIMFLPLIAVFGIGFALANNPPREVALLLLHGFAAIMGLSFATIFIVFKLGSIVSAFMGAAVLFGVMSFYGYFTKRSLDSLGKFMFIGLIAIIIASIANIFIGSGPLGMVISALAIIIFTALTAYDTQKIREELQYVDVHPSAEVRGALTLYLDFINIFLSLLQLTGSKNE
jgi:FtsH-binding integral membrane protein